MRRNAFSLAAVPDQITSLLLDGNVEEITVMIFETVIFFTLSLPKHTQDSCFYFYFSVSGRESETVHIRSLLGDEIEPRPEQ